MNKSKQSLIQWITGRALDDGDRVLGLHLLHSTIAVETRDIKVLIQAQKRARKKEKKEWLRNEAMLSRIEDFEPSDT